MSGVYSRIMAYMIHCNTEFTSVGRIFLFRLRHRQIYDAIMGGFTPQHLLLCQCRRIRLSPRPHVRLKALLYLLYKGTDCRMTPVANKILSRRRHCTYIQSGCNLTQVVSDLCMGENENQDTSFENFLYLFSAIYFSTVSFTLLAFPFPCIYTFPYHLLQACAHNG